MLGRQALLQAATNYLRNHPDEIARILRNAIGLRFGVPMASLRWLAGQGDGEGARDIDIEAAPPGVSMAATVALMGTTVRARTTIFIEQIRASAEELRLEIRLEGTTLTVLGDAESPVAALIKSGALDLTKAGNLAAQLPKLNQLLGDSTGNRLVIDLMKHPKLGKNKAVRRVVGLVSSFVTIGGIETDEGHLDMRLRMFPRGVGGAVQAMKDHLLTDGPPWFRGMLPGRRATPRPGY